MCVGLRGGRKSHGWWSGSREVAVVYIQEGRVGVASRWETEWLVVKTQSPRIPLLPCVTHDGSVEVKHRDASAPRMQGRL